MTNNNDEKKQKQNFAAITNKGDKDDNNNNANNIDNIANNHNNNDDNDTNDDENANNIDAETVGIFLLEIIGTVAGLTWGAFSQIQNSIFTSN